MKYLLPLLLLAASLQAVAQPKLNNANLIAYYPLNGNFLDYSGNNNHIIPHGNMGFTTDQWGNANRAARFDGIDDWMETPLNEFSKGSFTILCYHKYDTIQGGEVLFNKINSSANVNHFKTWSYVWNSVGFVRTLIGYFRSNCTSSAVQTGSGSNTTPIPVGSWSCLGFSYDRDSNKSRTWVYTLTNYKFNHGSLKMDTCGNTPLTIGKMLGGSFTQGKGAIDEIRIYNTSAIESDDVNCDPSNPTIMCPYCSLRPPVVMQPFADSQLCVGQNITVGYDGGDLKTGNNVIVQLSNAGGSFASPVTIGTASTTLLAGTITCTVPANTMPGTGYRIRLVTTNTADTSKDNGQNIRISQYPSIAASGTSPVCSGDSLFLYGSATPGSVYTWSGPVSFTSTVQNPVLANTTTANSGDYTVTANYYSCISKDTVTITVKPLPAPVANSNSPVCEGGTLNLTSANAGSGSTYSWTGPASFISNIQNPAITNTQLTSNGDYIVTATMNGCIARDTISVLVKPTPAVPAANSNSPVCSGNSLNLTASSTTNGVSYNWSGPMSFISTTQNPTLVNTTTSMSGAYSVTATLNGCTSAAGTTAATVNLTPAIPTATSNSPVCAGGSINLSANSTTGTSYSWTGPNGFTSNTQNPSISPAPLNGGGTYNVTAELNGCTSTGSGSTNVIVNNVSSLGVYPSPNDTLCINNAAANFVAVPFNAGTAPQYQWYKNNNLIGGATNISYSTSGIADGDSFYCRMTVTGLCADPLILYSNKVGMTVLPLTSGPSITITADPGTLLSPWQLVKFTAVATNAGALPKYQWKRNGQDVIGATSNVWSANNLSNGDTISCVVTSDVWCASPASEASNRMVVNIKTGISDIGADRKLELYPNPNNGSFVVYLPLTPSRGGHVRVDVVDALGRTVYSDHQLNVVDNRLEIALPASVANGVYMLKLQADSVVYHARFTVSR